MNVWQGKGYILDDIDILDVILFSLKLIVGKFLLALLIKLNSIDVLQSKIQCRCISAPSLYYFTDPRKSKVWICRITAKITSIYLPNYI